MSLSPGDSDYKITEKASRGLAALRRLVAKRSPAAMRWAPVQIFHTRVVAIEEDTTSAEGTPELYSVTEYRWASPPEGLCDEGAVVATLRERREVSGPTIRDLSVAKSEQVDNTGNFHWPSEDLLCRVLFEQLPSPIARCGIIELGAGCGLTSVVMHRCGAGTVVATDGNSRVFATLQSNARRADPEQARLHAQLLPWQDSAARTSVFEQLQGEMSKRGLDRAVLCAADCLFFESYHRDLALLVRRFAEMFKGFKPVVYLLAPSRGGSLERFEAVLSAELEGTPFGFSRRCVGAWYESAVTQTAAANPTVYSADRHLAHLLVVC